VQISFRGEFVIKIYKFKSMALIILMSLIIAIPLAAAGAALTSDYAGIEENKTAITSDYAITETPATCPVTSDSAEAEGAKQNPGFDSLIGLLTLYSSYACINMIKKRML
jgi:hypothetical protein